LIGKTAANRQSQVTRFVTCGAQQWKIITSLLQQTVESVRFATLAPAYLFVAHESRVSLAERGRSVTVVVVLVGLFSGISPGPPSVLFLVPTLKIYSVTSCPDLSAQLTLALKRWLRSSQVQIPSVTQKSRNNLPYKAFPTIPPCLYFCWREQNHTTERSQPRTPFATGYVVLTSGARFSKKCSVYFFFFALARQRKFDMLAPLPR
jgi:hypothetical protein